MWDYLDFADTFLGEPESSELVVETFLKSLGEGKYERLDGARLTLERRSRFCESNCIDQNLAARRVLELPFT